MKVQRPIPNRTLLAFNETPGVFESFLTSWNFLVAHGHPLHLSPFTLDEFEGALRHNLLEPPCTLLGEIHSTLVYILRTVPSNKELGIESLQASPQRPTYGISVEDLLTALEATGSNWERVPLRATEGRRGWEEAMIGCLKSVSC
jgi:bromodomain adjacent to zinc finger domain protein 1A